MDYLNSVPAKANPFPWRLATLPPGTVIKAIDNAHHAAAAKCIHRSGSADIGAWPGVTQVSAAATEAAGQLWAHVGLDAGAPEEMAAAAEQGCARLRAGLTRWIGSDGYHALFDRALEQARAAHPAIAGLQGQVGDVQGVAAAVGGHSAAEVKQGMIALVALLIDLLSRVIGAELAMKLVEQAWAGSARPAASTVTGEVHDG